VTVRRRLHDEASLADLAEELSLPVAEVERDYLLVFIAAQLEADFEGAFCFKGGFVLRHVHRQNRLSVDIDATRQNPHRHKFDAAEVGSSIGRAGRGVFRVRVSEPQTDSGRSLDFDKVAYTGPLGSGTVAVEVSYREGVVLEPVRAEIGPPFFDPFEIPVMAPDEIVAEKLRTLAQRRRPTDLSDIAFLLSTAEIDPSVVRRVAVEKFAPGLVQPGDHAARIASNVEGMAAVYDATIGTVAPDSPPHAEAAQLLLRQLHSLLP
jgi:predicted nucleotidyltransferase component of viral defense system